jgi:hypothetical protein
MPDNLQKPQRRIPVFIDFEIEIKAGNAQNQEYIVSVRSPSGEAREIMKFPFSPQELDSRLKDIQIALLRSATPGRLALTPEAKAVQEFGRLLFNALMVGEVRDTYAQSQVLARGQDKGLRLKMRIDPPELAGLPWEFLYDSREAEYICLSRNTPLVRYIDVPLSVSPLETKLPLRILGMVASPADQVPLKVAAEKKRVNDALARLIENGQVELVWLDGGTWQDLFNAMDSGPWHIFHFIGHGGYDRVNDEGTVLFEGPDGGSDPMRATQLARLLADHENMRLVVMNSCEGARGGREDLFSSTASILVRRGIPAVLAMQYEISDAAAIAFSNFFYRALAEGTPVDAAVNGARVAMSLQLRDTLEWVTPVLYLRSPDGVIFHLDTSSSPAVSFRSAPEQPAPQRVEPLPLPTPEIVSKPFEADPALPAKEPPIIQKIPAPVEPQKKTGGGFNKLFILGAGGLVILIMCGCLAFAARNMVTISSGETLTPTATTTTTTTTDTAVPVHPATATATTFIVLASPAPALTPPTPVINPPTPDPLTLAPVQAISAYWKYFGEGNYVESWKYLSARYQQANYQGDREKYIANQTKKYCDVYLSEPRVLTLTPQTAYILGTVVYKMGPACTEAPNILVHKLILSDSKWVLDRALLGVGKDSNCALASQTLSVGITAQVATRSESLVLRAYPGVTDPKIDPAYIFTLLQPKTEVTVLDGPICGEYKSVYFWWWKVRAPIGAEGWVVEGSDSTDPVFIQPVP